MGIAIVVCLLIIVLSFIFASPIGAVMVSIANWINKKAGVNHTYSVKGRPEFSVSFGEPNKEEK